LFSRARSGHTYRTEKLAPPFGGDPRQQREDGRLRPASTSDDVSITRDGRRLDSKNAVLLGGPTWPPRSRLRKPPVTGAWSLTATPEGPDLQQIFDALALHKVEYLLVGGIAARAYGARRPTFDVILADIPDRLGWYMSYRELVERASELNLDGIVVRVAALDDVIASKEWAGRPKDRDALPEVRALRDE